MAERHESGIWFDTADSVGWADGGSIELRAADGTVIAAKLTVEEQFTGTEEVPMPVATGLDGTPVSFFDFEQWRHPA
jgi:hypothetical protein